MMTERFRFKRRVIALIVAHALLATCALSIQAAQQEGSLPHLHRQGTATQLIVDGKPFLILGGELGNSTSSSLEYMRALWPKFVSLNWPDYDWVVYHARDYNIDTSKIMFTGSSIQLSGSDAQPADKASPRTDQNSMIAHEQLLEKARSGRINIYFEGDSITRRWGTSDEQYRQFLTNWRENFFGWNAADFGWGGDTTQNILWRLDKGELDNVNPKIIVLLAGTNNVGNKSPQGSEDSRVNQITRGIKAIIDVCRQKAPHATIVLMGITPRNDNMLVMPIINQINDRIAKFADGKKIRYLNINDKLADKDGKLFEGMAVKDGLHLDVKGYQVWANALKPIFRELLGPPSKEDHAPPPTGDPSASKHHSKNGVLK